MPDTFFTASPHWAWYITFYFFIGGIAGGSFFISSMLQLFGKPSDRPMIRLGYYVAFAGAVISGALLTLDLNRPLRFWHMLIESNTGQLMFKAWSPMSVGSWGLFLFSIFAFLAAVGALAEEGFVPRRLSFLTTGKIGNLVAISGCLLGFFLAGYTGVLLSVTNRPIWADSSFLGLVFLLSGASTGAATLILLARWRGEGSGELLGWLSRLDAGALTLELLGLIILVVSLGSVARVLVGAWGAVFLIGVVGAGILAPLYLELRAKHDPARLVMPATLVIVGGFLLRFVVIFSSESIHVAGSGVVF